MRIPNPLGKKYVEAEENFCLSHCCNIFSIIYFIYYFMVFPYCRGFLYSMTGRGTLGSFISAMSGRPAWTVTCIGIPGWGKWLRFLLLLLPGWSAVLNPVFVLALVLGLYVLALGRECPNLRRSAGAWTWLFALSMFVSAGVTVYYVCLTRAGSMNYVWTGCLIVWFANIYRTRWGKRITSSMGPVLRMSDLWDFLAAPVMRGRR